MSYDYQTERPRLFTGEGQRTFLKVRDQASSLLKTAGAARMQEIALGFAGDSWELLACVDRLVELGELRELDTQGAAQNRVFVRAA